MPASARRFHEGPRPAIRMCRLPLLPCGVLLFESTRHHHGPRRAGPRRWTSTFREALWQTPAMHGASHLVEPQLLLDELCCDLSRFEHVSRGGLAPERVQSEGESSGPPQEDLF